LRSFSVKLSQATQPDPRHMLIEFGDVWPSVGCVNMQVLGLTSAVFFMLFYGMN